MLGQKIQLKHQDTNVTPKIQTHNILTSPIIQTDKNPSEPIIFSLLDSIKNAKFYVDVTLVAERVQAVTLLPMRLQTVIRIHRMQHL
jgi:hypothetical protein